MMKEYTITILYDCKSLQYTAGQLCYRHTLLLMGVVTSRRGLYHLYHQMQTGPTHYRDGDMIDSQG